MLRKTLKSAELRKVCSNLRSQGRKIVFTYGTFDLIHSGHAAYLLNARTYGDVLIVGVSSNNSQEKLAGKGIPLIDQKNRAELLNYFDFVDYTMVANKRDLLPVLKVIKPDVFVSLGSDWRSHLRKKKEADYLKKIGCQVIKKKKAHPFVPANEVVSKVADLKLKEMVEYFFGKVKIDLSKGDWQQKKWSGLKTGLRSEALYFGDHSKEIGLFSKGFFGEILDITQFKQLSKNLKQNRKKIVLSSGSCDLVHAGHARFYAKAKSLGDILVLAIPSNNVIRKQKGRGRPIVDEKSRAELMAFFGFVDYVVIFDTDSVLPVIEQLKPDIFFTVKEEWNEIAATKNPEILKDWKGKIEAVPPQSPKLSSSKLIRKAAGIRVREVFKEVLREAEKWSVIKD